jgi:hypothetical protein
MKPSIAYTLLVSPIIFIVSLISSHLPKTVIAGIAITCLFGMVYFFTRAFKTKNWMKKFFEYFVYGSLSYSIIMASIKGAQLGVIPGTIIGIISFIVVLYLLFFTIKVYILLDTGILYSPKLQLDFVLTTKNFDPKYDRVYITLTRDLSPVAFILNKKFMKIIFDDLDEYTIENPTKEYLIMNVLTARKMKKEKFKGMLNL